MKINNTLLSFIAVVVCIATIAYMVTSQMSGVPKPANYRGLYEGFSGSAITKPMNVEQQKKAVKAMLDKMDERIAAQKKKLDEYKLAINGDPDLKNAYNTLLKKVNDYVMVGSVMRFMERLVRVDGAEMEELFLNSGKDGVYSDEIRKLGEMLSSQKDASDVATWGIYTLTR